MRAEFPDLHGPCLDRHRASARAERRLRARIPRFIAHPMIKVPAIRTVRRVRISMHDRWRSEGPDLPLLVREIEAADLDDERASCSSVQAHRSPTRYSHAKMTTPYEPRADRPFRREACIAVTVGCLAAVPRWAMQVKRFGVRVAADPRGHAVVAIPFDPDQAWGAKARHHVNGTVNGCRVRVTLMPATAVGLSP